MHHVVSENRICEHTCCSGSTAARLRWAVGGNGVRVRADEGPCVPSHAAACVARCGIACSLNVHHERYPSFVAVIVIRCGVLHGVPCGTSSSHAMKAQKREKEGVADNAESEILCAHSAYMPVAERQQPWQLERLWRPETKTERNRAREWSLRPTLVPGIS